MLSEEIVFNAIETPDGTILVSSHRHDCQSYKDENGFYYSVDGGLDYLRRSFNSDAPPAKEISLTLSAGIDKIRHVISWGTYGKFGDEPYRRVLLKDMEEDHIQACLDTQKYMYPQLRKAFEMELAYRRRT